MKTTVFIIHGWTYSLDKWTAVCDLLKQNDIEPILLKVPGLTEPSVREWDIQGYIKWLDKKLAGHSKPIVVGHSNGGRIALSYIQEYPGNVGQLFLIDSAGIVHDQTKSRLKLKVLRVISKIGKVFSFIPPVKKIFYKLIGAQDYLHAPPNMKVTMQNMLKADALIDLSKIGLPTTIIWGKEDTVTPLSDGETFHAGLVDSELFIIDGARHAPQSTHPDQVADIIIKKVTRT